MFDGLLRPLADRRDLARARRDDAARAGGTALADRARPARPGPDRAGVALDPGSDPGADLDEGGLLGTVDGAGPLAHRVLVPPGACGTVAAVRPPGPCPAPTRWHGSVAWPSPLVSRWPVRRPRPVRERLDARTRRC